MSFRSRLFLSSIVVVSLIVAVSIIVVNDRFINFAQEQLREQLVQAPTRFDSFQRSRMSNLIAQSANMAQDPKLRGTLATGDVPTIAEAAAEINTLYNMDLFWVLDRDGRVIHRVDEPQKAGDDLTDRPLVRDVLNGYDSGDIWLRHGRLYQVAATPVVSGRQELGILLVGRRFQSWINDEFERLTGTGVAFLLPDSSVSSSLEGLSWGSVSDRVRARLAQGDVVTANVPRVPWLRRGPDTQPPDAPVVRMDVEDHAYGAAIFELQNVRRDSLATGLLLRSMAPVQELLPRVRTMLLVVGLGAVLFAGVLSFFLARGLVRPIQRLVRYSERLGEGDLDTPVGVVSDDEIGTLARALDEMRSSLKQAREDLIRNERLSTIGRMASTITHDFRQPITAIYGYMQLIGMDQATADRRKELADKVLRQIDRMQGMINELLDFARGRVALERKPVDWQEFLESVAQDFETESRTLDIEIALDNDHKGSLHIDRGRLERSVENLVRNAVQAIGRGGRVELASKREDGEVVLEIRDNGPGIPDEIREKLFQPFFTHGKSQGTGLGLALTQNVVREHGGSIRVHSEVDVGTTFEIRLPLDANEQEAAS